MVAVESFGITDVGKKRKKNEDALFLDDMIGLYIVADGMGGHQAGEVASALVVKTIQDYMKRCHEEDPEAIKEVKNFDASLSMEANRLASSVYLANKTVYQLAQSNDAYSGMGSTVAVAYFTDKSLIVANVGDSPVYLIHNGNIDLFSVIHNVISEQSAINPSASEHIAEEYKYLLTRGMGIEETVQPDVREIQYVVGDIVLIGSDGLTDLVSSREIFDVLTTEPIQKACRTLVDMANDRGGHDNITVIAIKVKNDKDKNGWIRNVISGIANRFMRLNS